MRAVRPGFSDFFAVAVVIAGALLAQLLLAVPARAAGARSFKSGPIQISADGRWVWVVNPDDDSVSRLDTVDDSVLRFPLPDAGVRHRPRGLSLREDGSEVWVACHDSDRVYVLAGTGAGVGSRLARIDLPWGSGPHSIALSRDQGRALVTLHRAEGLALLDVAGRRLATVLAPVYQAPLGIAWTEDGVSAWVTHMGSGLDEVYFTRVDVSGPQPRVTSRIFTFPAPPMRSASFTDPDPAHNVAEGGYLFLRGHLAQVPGAASRDELWIPTEYHNVHENLYAAPPRSTNQSSVRRFDLARRVLRTDLILDKVILSATAVHDNTTAWAGPGWDAGVAGPVDIAFSADGAVAWVVHEQSDDVVVMPAATPAFRPTPATPPLAEIAVGAHPMGIAVSPVVDVAYVANELGSKSGSPPGRTVSVIDLVGLRELRQVVVAPETYTPSRLLGAKLFHSSDDPRISSGARVACATCHPHGEQDRRLWDLQHTPGLHGPRYTMSLLGLGRHHVAGARDPEHGWGLLHLSGDRDEVQDFEHTFSGVMMGGTGFLGAAVNPELGAPNAGRSPELDALADYVLALEPLPRSPHRAADGALSAAAVRGATFFMGADGARPADAGCASCHDPLRGFTDGRFHDVGQYHLFGEAELGARNPPWSVRTLPLVGAWATPPFEGFAADHPPFTMLDALRDFAAGGRHGALSGLDRRQLRDLAELVLSLDGDVRAEDVIGARDTAPPRVVRVEAASLSTINVWFDESVDAATATDPASWTLLEEGTTPVPVTAVTHDAVNGDRVDLSATLRGGCVSYLLRPGPILDRAGSASGGVANALDPADPRNAHVLVIGDEITVTLGGSGHENIRVPVHDAAMVGSWTWDSPFLTPKAGQYQKGLVRFEWRDAFAAVSGLADPADLLEARFSIVPEYGDASPVEARRVLLAWSDVHNGFTRRPPGGVTWTHHVAPDMAWNQAGARQTAAGIDGSRVSDYDGVNDVSDVIDTSAAMAAINQRLEFAGDRVTEAYRFWLANPGVDHGHILELAPGALGEVAFRAAEGELGDDGPVLTLRYRVASTPPPAAPGEVSGRGSAAPLLAAKAAGGPGDTVLLSFEDLGAAASSYNVYEGAIGRYDAHRGGAGCNRPAAAVAFGRRELRHVAAPGSYILVTASNCAAEGPDDPDHDPALRDCPP